MYYQIIIKENIVESLIVLKRELKIEKGNQEKKTKKSQVSHNFKLIWITMLEKRLKGLFLF